MYRASVCDLQRISIPIVLHVCLPSFPTKVYKSAIKPSRFKHMACGKLAEDGAYSRSVLNRLLLHHVGSLRSKAFFDKLVTPVHRNAHYSVTFQEEVLESKTAYVHAYKVSAGDVCLGTIPCVVQSCLQIRKQIFFTVYILQLEEDSELWSVWKKNGHVSVVPAAAIGPSPTWWSWDLDSSSLTCLV